MFFNKNIAWIFFIAFTFLSCQQYHDITARYNAYFLANERMTLAENELFGTPQDDYNDILLIFEPIDSTKTNSQKEAFEYVIKKASRPIKFHEISEWVDDCYMLIGRCRLYQEQYEYALNTFKYVLSNSESPDMQHEALIWMLRMFIETGEIKNMQLVIETINKSTYPYNKENQKKYHLNMAHHYRLNREYKLASEHLALATPLEEERGKKARYYFILGQLYREIGNDIGARDSFKKAQKFTKSADLSFQAMISAKSLEDFDPENPKTVKKINKFFKRQLKEEINWDNRDKIYYEMARFSHRMTDTDKALEQLNESVVVSTKNQGQKGYSYLMSAEIYYLELKDFESAAAYYDSAAQSLPETAEDYEEIKARAEYLQELAKYSNIIKHQDRLIYLSKIEADSQVSFLEREIEKEKEIIIQKKAYERLGEQKRQRVTVASSASQSRSSETWYFYNENNANLGASEFLRVWGSRPLEDDWRRSSKPISLNTSNDRSNTPPRRTSKGDQKKSEEKEEDLFASIKSLEDRLKEIPSNQSEMDSVNTLLGDALFELGKVYMYKVKSDAKTLEQFQRLSDSLSTHKDVPETLYLLYVMCQTSDLCDASSYKDRLIQDYPESFYAKVLVNPDFVKEMNLEDKEVTQKYELAYALYKQDSYKEALDLVDELIALYPENTMSDKIHLLKVLLIGRTASFYSEYYNALNEFIKNYPESELKAYAQKLLETITQENLKKGYIPGRY